jgi:hypothetical protein
VPAVSCRCDIYSHKPGHADDGEGLPVVPRVRGWVELTGTVVEGTRGYRAEQACLVGPLELEVPCAGPRNQSGHCVEPAVVVARTGVVSYRGRCADETHASRTGGTPVEVWRAAAIEALTARYRVSVVTFT